MGKVSDGFILSSLLLIAGLLNWSLISFTSLLASLIFRFTSPKTGFQYGGRVLLWFVFIYSALVIISQVIFLILCAILDWRWSVADAWWIKLIGLMNVESWISPTVIYFLVVQSLAGLTAFVAINWSRIIFIESRNSCWGHLSSLLEHIGYRLRLVCCLVLPAVQLASGISDPSSLSLPFFICSCVGLVDWSLTSNFLGLFRWWKLLWLYTGFNIGLLYVYQLPIWFPQSLKAIADSIGLYKASVSSDWQEIYSGISLMVFYYMELHTTHSIWLKLANLDDFLFITEELSVVIL